MKNSFVRAVSRPHGDYIAILRRRVNANKAGEREGFRNRLFPLGSGFAETEQAEIRPKQPASAQQGAAGRIGVISDAK